MDTSALDGALDGFDDDTALDMDTSALDEEVDDDSALDMGTSALDGVDDDSALDMGTSH